MPINPTASSVQRFRASRRGSITWFPRMHWLRIKRAPYVESQKSRAGKKKKKKKKTLKKAGEQLLEAFASLESSAEVTADVTEQLELYAPLTQFKTVKELRWFLLSKRQYSDEKLPPTKAALEQMIKRANYVALVWKN